MHDKVYNNSDQYELIFFNISYDFLELVINNMELIINNTKLTKFSKLSQK